MKKKEIALARVPYSGVYTVFKKLPKDREIRPPLGLFYLAGGLRKEGIGVEIIDGEVELLNAERIAEKAGGFPFVGLTSTTPEFHIVSDVARRLKKTDPSVKIILGGPHASAVPEEIADRYPWFDYIVVGEGEEALPRIVKDPPQERIVKAEIIKDIDSIPLPAKDLVDYASYRYPFPKKGLLRMDAILTSRGCPYDCSFCYKTFGGGLRYRNIGKVVDEIEWVHKDKKAESFLLFDDTFTFRRDRVEEFCREVKKRKLKVYFYCFTRADAVTRDMLKLMKESGFIKITMGVESGNQRVLDSIRKKTKLEEYKQAYKWMKELGIETRASFIFGLPHESKKEVMDSINFAKELDIYSVGFNILTPYPGTELYEMAKKGNDGLRLTCENWNEFRRWGNAVVETPHLKRGDLMRLQKQALQEFYVRPKIIWYYISQFFRMKQKKYYYRPLMFAVGVYLRKKVKKRTVPIKRVLRRPRVKLRYRRTKAKIKTW